MHKLVNDNMKVVEKKHKRNNSHNNYYLNPIISRPESSSPPDLVTACNSGGILVFEWYDGRLRAFALRCYLLPWSSSNYHNQRYLS